MLKSLKYIVLINGLLFASELKTPGEFLGYELGDYFTPHYKVVSYYEHVSEEESNVKTIKYGETYERRPLMVAIISSEKNMSMLEDLRIDNLKRAGILKGKPNNKKIGIDEIRSIKSKFNTNSFNNEPRFTILDDADLLNTNSANSLLKGCSIIDLYVNSIAPQAV